MSQDEHWTPFKPAIPPPVSQPGELLHEFLHGHTRIRYELTDLGPKYGVQIRVFHNERFFMSHAFAPWHSIPFMTPRDAAIAWALRHREDTEKGGIW
jgi:hypothetical protein